jgi:hypothetical protein
MRLGEENGWMRALPHGFRVRMGRACMAFLEVFLYDIQN